MTSTRRISRGTCAFCHESFTKREMDRHLTACLARHPQSRLIRGFHLLVEGADAPQYWMHLAARADAELGELDELLRDAWLECCSHCSAFTIAGRRYDITDERVGWLPKNDLGMQTKLCDVLRPGMTFDYEYDFGSTTELRFHVVAEMAHMPRGKSIRLLALNDAPSYPCALCGEAAQLIDMEEERLLCKECAPDNAAEDMALPLVNSPRTGVCGYCGPVIHLRKPRKNVAGPTPTLHA